MKIFCINCWIQVAYYYSEMKLESFDKMSFFSVQMSQQFSGRNFSNPVVSTNLIATEEEKYKKIQEKVFYRKVIDKLLSI